MLPATEDERAEVIEYYLSQSPRAEVTFLQKVYSEAIIGHRHDVWDVHSVPQYGHCGDVPHGTLSARTPYAAATGVRPEHRAVWGYLHQAARDFRCAGAGSNIADYQAIGMRCRETLLAFVAAAQDIAEWTAEGAPKRADFRAWSDLICNVALAGSGQKERRHLFKSLLVDAWVFANWLTHAQSATWHDAEAAETTVGHVLGLAMSLVIRHIRSVPEVCPACGSPHLSPEEGWRDNSPEVAWERPVCADCGWTGKPVPVGERSAEPEGDDLITRIGGAGDEECIIPTVALTKLNRPGDV